jgi:hypothetical protein
MGLGIVISHVGAEFLNFARRYRKGSGTGQQEVPAKNTRHIAQFQLFQTSA